DGGLTIQLAIGNQIRMDREEAAARSADLEAAREELERLHSRAKQAGIPPGWTRNKKVQPATDLVGKIREAEDTGRALLLERNELRNKLNLKMNNPEREPIAQEIEKKRAAIQANDDQVEKLRVEADDVEAEQRAADWLQNPAGRKQQLQRLE